MEDREILEKYLKECESKFLMGSEVSGTELYKPIKNLLKENNELKQALIINKNLYEEVCNKNKELEEKIREQIKWLDNDIKNTKYKLEHGKTYPNYIGEHRRLRMKAFITKSKEFRNRLQELLRRRGEIRCVNVVMK